jgi:hypothetical protein
LRPACAIQAAPTREPRLPNILSMLKSALFPDTDTRAFIRHNREAWRGWAGPRGKAEILVELYAVTQTVISFSYFANILARRHGARIKSFSSSRRNAFLYTLRHRASYSVFKSFNVSGHINTGPILPTVADRADREFRRIRPSIRGKWDIFRIEVENCPIGCDIYESFLMDFRKPTVDLEGPEFDAHLRSCLEHFFFWQAYVESHDVRAVIMSHGLYKHGIFKRICIRKGIPVYLPAVRSMLYLSAMEELGNPKFEAYPEHFRSLPAEVQEQGLAWAKAQLDRRMAGEVGVDMHYSTKSAYGKKAHGHRLLNASPKLKILIATHCFFDNPHAYGVNLFPDFYEWLEYLGKVSEETDYEWYLKTHPDVLPGNNEILAEILARYPRIKKLPETASHHQLCEEGISVVLTIYGSIGHEYPLMGRHVINAGKNPHIAYGFNYHPATIEEYRLLLFNLDKLDKSIDLNELYEFYFVHYKCNVCETLFFESFGDFSTRFTAEEQNSPIAYRYFLGQLAGGKHESLIRIVKDFLASGEYKYFEPRYAVSGPKKEKVSV